MFPCWKMSRMHSTLTGRRHETLTLWPIRPCSPMLPGGPTAPCDWKRQDSLCLNPQTTDLLQAWDSFILTVSPCSPGSPLSPDFPGSPCHKHRRPSVLINKSAGVLEPAVWSDSPSAPSRPVGRSFPVALLVPAAAKDKHQCTETLGQTPIDSTGEACEEKEEPAETS